MTVCEFTEDQLDYIRAYLAQVRERAKLDREELRACHQPGTWGDTVWSQFGVSETDAQTAW